MEGVPGISGARLVGVGASAAVYAAVREHYGDMVAVKVLRQGLATPYQRAQFDKEVAALETLREVAGIVGVLDSGVTPDGSPYLVMPFFERGSAQDYIDAEGPLDWRAATQMVIDASLAVHRAHELGIVHRDLKPANLLLTATGRAFVADFGIAKIRDSDLATTPGVTPSFAPPEAFDLKFGPASDVYGLAATLAGLVMGKPPFLTGDLDEDTLSKIMFRVMSETPPNVSDYGCPGELARLVAGAMAKNAADRPQSAQTFAHQLESVLRTEGAASDIPAIAPPTLLAPSELPLASGPGSRPVASPPPSAPVQREAASSPPRAAGPSEPATAPGPVGPPPPVRDPKRSASRTPVLVVLAVLAIAGLVAVAVVFARGGETVAGQTSPTPLPTSVATPAATPDPGPSPSAEPGEQSGAANQIGAQPTRFQVSDTVLVGTGTHGAVQANGLLWVPFNRGGFGSGSGAIVVVDTSVDDVIQEIDVGGNVFEPIVDGDFLWVPVDRGAQGGAVVVIDLNTLAVVDTIDLDGTPATPLAHAGVVWVPVGHGFGESGSLVALDRFGRTVLETIETFTEPLTPVVADDLVWVPTGGDRLDVVDPGSLMIVDRIVVGDDGPFSGLGVPAVYDDRLYVPHLGNGEVFIVDAKLRTVEGRIGGFTAPLTPILVDGALWVADADGSTSRADSIRIIDPAAQTVAGSIAVGDVPNEPTVVGELAFVTNFGTGSLMVIDIATQAVVQELSLSPGPDRAVRANGKVWIPHIESDTIAVIDL